MHSHPGPAVSEPLVELACIYYACLDNRHLIPAFVALQWHWQNFGDCAGPWLAALTGRQPHWGANLGLTG